MKRFSGNAFYELCEFNTMFVWRTDSGTCRPVEQALNRVKGQVKGHLCFDNDSQCQAVRNLSVTKTRD